MRGAEPAAAERSLRRWISISFRIHNFARSARAAAAQALHFNCAANSLDSAKRNRKPAPENGSFRGGRRRRTFAGDAISRDAGARFVARAADVRADRGQENAAVTWRAFQLFLRRPARPTDVRYWAATMAPAAVSTGPGARSHRSRAPSARDVDAPRLARQGLACGGEFMFT